MIRRPPRSTLFPYTRSSDLELPFLTQAVTVIESSDVGCPGKCDTLSTTRSARSEEHTSELQSQSNLVCRLLLEKKKNSYYNRQLLVCTRPPAVAKHTDQRWQ